MTRRKNDFYETPEWATHVLVESVPMLLEAGVILEPCNGDGAISSVLKATTHAKIITNDYDLARDADGHVDATESELWTAYRDYHVEAEKWVVSNPPFKHAFEITKHAVECATGGVAMLLRLSFLEPTKKRGLWLAQNPPTKLIILPRISFTGDGRTDSVTCAWMVWEKGLLAQDIEIIPKAA